MELFAQTGDAIIEGIHRYMLSRIWEHDKPKILFIGVNPSKADAIHNDPTIVRCINFARSWGYGGMYMGNLFSYRTPYVSRKQMELVPSFEKEEIKIAKWEPLLEHLHEAANEKTDLHLRLMIEDSEKVVAAWGSWKFTEARVIRVLEMISNPYCFGTNKDGSPKHPLYLSGKTQLVSF